LTGAPPPATLPRMLSPVLTLALPTYNRAASIGVALQSLARGLRDCAPGAIEIDVRDNASADDTAALVRSFAAQHPWVHLRYARNEENIGYDGNHLRSWNAARGRYILFCSDRYYYGVDFRPVLAALQGASPAGLVFSDRFRAVWPTPAGTPDKVCDEWLVDKLDGTMNTYDGWQALATTAAGVVASGALKLNWIAANVSDVIIRRDCDARTTQLLERFVGTYLLVVAALLLPFRNPADAIAVTPITWFTSAFAKMISGGQRHDQLRVAHGHVTLASAFPFIGSAAEVAAFEARVLLRNYLPIASSCGGYEHTYRASDIQAFVIEHGIRISPLRRLALRALQGVTAESTIKALGKGFEASLIVGRHVREMSRVGRSLMALARAADH
jgi:hypothetical protein